MTAREQHTAARLVPEVGTELANPVSGTRTVFRATSTSTSGAHVEVEQTYPPHSARPPRHLHPAQDEHFTVVSGSLHAVLGEVEHDLLPGEQLDVLRGTPHRMWATAEGPTVVIWRISPALRTDQLFCGLWSAASEAGFEPDPMRAYQVTLRYAEEFQLC
jgi:quercetin dioxygenase-like cupin family protein